MNLIARGDALASPPITRPVRLETLVRLRWLAIVGQSAGVAFVAFGLGFALPLAACAALIGLSGLLNVLLLLRFGPAHRPGSRLAALQLAYDCLQLGGLLFLTGGLGNPFALLLLAPVSVSASTLPARETTVLAGLVAVLASVLAVWHLPLPWSEQTPIVLPPLYLAGMWVSVLCGVAFLTAYTNRVAHEARQLADALTATELALSRQQQLSALDGMAAAAAHELGTPLATIALAAKEMRGDLEAGELADDLDLILGQVARCRAILGRLRSLEPGGADPFASVPVADLIAEVARPHMATGKPVQVVADTEHGPAPQFPRNVAILYGLGNLIENAVQFARSGVVVSAHWDARRVAITITDDGPGFPAELITRLGEPYLTTRWRDRGEAEGRDSAGGLGLGVFIAKTLLERSGASLKFWNARANGHASIEIAWPRQALSAADPREGL